MLLNKDLKKYFESFLKKNKNINIKIKLYVYLRLLISSFNTIYEIIPKKINKVIDIGGGFGIFSDYLVFKNNKLNIEVSEFNESRVFIGKKIINKKINFSAKDASKEKFKNYELITMIDVLHHIPFEKQREIFKNLSEDTNKNTRIIIKDIEKNYFDPRYYFNYLHDFIMEKGGKLYFRKDKEFKKIFEEFGFEIIKRKKNYSFAPYSHILYLIKKK